MLLRGGSILAQASLLALLVLARGQGYDADYEVSEEGAGDHSGYSDEGQEQPDYSKYYVGDTDAPENAAQVEGKADEGFVAPIEFSTFFGTPHFAFDASSNEEVQKPAAPAELKKAAANGFASEDDFKGGFSEYDSDGFGTQDYFEQAQKQTAAAEEEGAAPKPGPSYISHKVPPKKAGYEAAIERERPSKYESVKLRNAVAEGQREAVEEKQRLKANYDLPSYTNSFKPSAPLNLPQFYQKHTNTQQQNTPYQKYSFQQPAASTYGLKEGVDPAASYNPIYAKVATEASIYETLPTELVSQTIGKDCVRINKPVSDKDAKFSKKPMNCFLCKDPRSGAKTELCSYTSDPNPKAYYTTTSYSNPENYRNKRDGSETYADPYEEIKAKSHEYYSTPEDFEKEFYKAPDFSKIGESYSYNPNNNNKEAEEKSYSEIQSEELLKKGEHCQQSTKNGATCTTCKDPKTGANFEQCSYASAPNEKKYAYVRESKYDGDGNPIEEKVVDSTNPKPVVSESQTANKAQQRKGNVEEVPQERKLSEIQQNRQSKSAKLIDDQPYDVPRHFAESTQQQQKAGVRGLDPALYGSADSSPGFNRGPQKFSEVDEYHRKLFPQFSDQASEKKETKAPPTYFEDLTAKKDVAKVLAEFSKKDRSNCKQISKKGMTCYLCVDKKGIQQEECMFVSESRPQSSHMAYHEVQHLKLPENANATGAESQISPVEALASEVQKRKLLKASDVLLADSEANASTNVETRVKYTPAEATKAEEGLLKKKRDAETKETRVKYTPVEAASLSVEKELFKDKRDAEPKETRSRPRNAEYHDPQPEFDIEDEGGLYTAETQPVFSRSIGMVLPKYMLEKSIFEIEFDKTVAAG